MVETVAMSGNRGGRFWLNVLGRTAAYLVLVVVVGVALSLARRSTGIDPRSLTGERLHAGQWMVILWVISMASPFLGLKPYRPRSWGRHALWSAIVAAVVAVISHREAFGL